jgi:hypothetical protein
MAMKPIKEKSQLEQAINTLEDAVESLDEMIKIMQDSQATLRSWLEPGKSIGWIDENK